MYDNLFIEDCTHLYGILSTLFAYKLNLSLYALGYFKLQ